MIVRLRFVSTIHAEESEIAGEAAEMSIDHKPLAVAPLEATL